MRNHVHGWSKFRALDPGRRRLVLEAAVMAAAVGIGLRTMSLARVRRVLDACSRILRSRSRTPLEIIACVTEWLFLNELKKYMMGERGGWGTGG